MVRETKQNSPENKRGKSDFIRFLGVASTVGINMVATTFVGFAIGHWVVDRYLRIAPWGTVVFTLLGIVAGFRYLFKLARKAGEENNGE
jgi:ATP synthase protein I